ncbi:hypothetical protein PAXRUDRAFT_177299 [Paxillus rubicundulus Ve08.2h10]|uniref:Uncharacterized protein n=1 Tax=Paxillus rubicundulus Ve08.2h10 TaxID=930991 RepID=A0A0D0D1U4_9AGAM|nr:hypothetical protein PAXRUDRAFT_177299 [Paxillus rubicundulus Ve08.2h10]
MFPADGKSNTKAALILANVWRFNNAHAHQLWDRQQEDQEEARQAENACLAKLKEQEKAARDEEEELARCKEHKKYKNKYAPILNTPLSDAPIFTPCRYADAKICSGDYCPLLYYTNKGHGNNLSFPDLDNGTLCLICSESGDVVLQATAEAKAKHCTPNEDLSWEEFSESNVRIIRNMERHSWENTRIDMVHSFWIEIESHRWRHSINNSNKRALMVFQGRVQRQWHVCIGTPAAFNLLPISDQQIREYRDELVDNTKSLEIAKLQQVCLITYTFPFPWEMSQHPLSSSSFHVRHHLFCSSKTTLFPSCPPSRAPTTCHLAALTSGLRTPVISVCLPLGPPSASG